ncbi:MAG: hypothetical protein AB1640_02810 [bacterium]
MSSLKGIGRPSVFLVLLLVLLAVKGWILSALLSQQERGTCFASTAAETGGEPAAPAVAAEETCCRGRLAGLLASIQEESGRLREKAGLLEEKEKRLVLYRKEVEERLRQLTDVRSGVEAMYKSLEQHDSEQDAKLVKIYEVMEPELAARRLEAMDDEVSSSLLLRMNPRQAGQVLGAMSTDKASRLTVRLSRKDSAAAVP